MRRSQSQTLQATAIALGGRGAILLGPSGSGKSDLALRVLGLGGKLIGDDLVGIARAGKQLTVSALKPLRGHIEVRGIGIVRLRPGQCRLSAPLRMAFALVSPGKIERLPEPRTMALLGVELPIWDLAPFEASAPDKLALLLGGAKLADKIPERGL